MTISAEEHQRREAILSTLAKDGNLREAAEIMGVCSGYVRPLARHYGIAWPRAKLPKKFKRERVDLAFEGNPTLQVAGDRLGVSRERARQLRVKAEIPKRPRDTTLCGWEDWADVLSLRDIQTLSGRLISSQGHSLPLGGIRWRSRRRVALALERDGWRQFDIAEVLGVQRTAVSSLISRARSRATP